jgi:hypothetical protein
MSALLFEIEVVPVYVLYLFYVTPGVIGCFLGFWRWWLGVIWLLIPLVFFLLLYWAGQYDHVYTFYEQIVRQEGRSYVVHSIIVPTLSVLLNVAGIGIGWIRRVIENEKDSRQVREDRLLER